MVYTLINTQDYTTLPPTRNPVYLFWLGGTSLCTVGSYSIEEDRHIIYTRSSIMATGTTTGVIWSEWISDVKLASAGNGVWWRPIVDPPAISQTSWDAIRS